MSHRAPTRAPLAPPLLLVVLALLATRGDQDAPNASVETQPPPLPALALEPAFGGARFDRPIEVAAYPGGRLLVAEQPGRVTALGPDGTAPALLSDLGSLIDIEHGEGLLSVALDPGFERNGQLWAYYFAAGEPPRSVLARFEVGAGIADPASALVVLELPQPGFNQNGGAMRFGPDGMLYLGLGDGSAFTDPFENGQDLATLLGAVVRLDVRAASAAAPYVVLPDNPFVGVEGARPEIWAYGLRNPWRMAFDPASGELWLGDVGVSDAEEVDRIECGANYGWSIREGFACLDRGGGCAGEGLTPPLAAYPHAAGRCAVTGGLVYRGDAIPALDGVYLYGDFCSGEIFALRPPAADAPPIEAEPRPPQWSPRARPRSSRSASTPRARSTSSTTAAPSGGSSPSSPRCEPCTSWRRPVGGRLVPQHLTHRFASMVRHLEWPARQLEERGFQRLHAVLRLDHDRPRHAEARGRPIRSPLTSGRFRLVACPAAGDPS